MISPRTPINKPRFVQKHYRVSKSQLINFITSVDFNVVTIPKEFAISPDETDFQPLVDPALGQMIIHSSPPKSTPRKLLVQLKMVEKVEKKISTSTLGESLDEDSFVYPGTPAPNAFPLGDDNGNEIKAPSLPVLNPKREERKNPHELWPIRA